MSRKPEVPSDNEDLEEETTSKSMKKNNLNLAIGIITEQTAKNKLYIPFPESIEVSMQPANMPEALFSFSAKEYYPLGIFNLETGKTVAQAQTKLKVSVRYTAPDDVYGLNIDESSYETVISQNKGIYWFGAIRGHIRGKIDVEIVAVNKSDIEPLVVSFQVLGGYEYFEALAESKDMEKSESNETIVDGENKSKPKSKSKNAALVDEEQANVEQPIKIKFKQKPSIAEELDNTKKKQKSKYFSESPRKDTLGEKGIKSNNVEVEMVEKSITSNSLETHTPKKRGRPPVNKHNFNPLEKTNEKAKEAEEEVVAVSSPKPKKKVVVGSSIVDKQFQTLPYPVHNALTASNRFQRPHIQEIVLKGRYFNVTLPPSLSIAIKDDRCRLASLQQKYPEVLESFSTSSENIDERFPIQLNYVTSSEAHPTVNELLHRLESKTGHITDSAALIQSMRNTFEYCFIGTILYQFEYAVMQSKLTDIIKRKVKFGDSFGAPFLLRLVILMVVSIDSDSMLNHDELSDSNDINLTKSQQRRNSVQEKQTKVLLGRFQEIIEILIADLDEFAHLLFY